VIRDADFLLDCIFKTSASKWQLNPDIYLTRFFTKAKYCSLKYNCGYYQWLGTAVTEDIISISFTVILLSSIYCRLQHIKLKQQG